MRIVYCILAFILLVWIVTGSVMGQETHSVLVNPPSQETVAPQVQPPVVSTPSVIMLYERGLFGRWYARPVRLTPVQPVLVQPVRPTILWTPTVIWR